jgi:hypothetical protein
MTFASLRKTAWKYKGRYIFLIIVTFIVCWFWNQPGPGVHGFLPVEAPGDVICPTPDAYHAYYDHGSWILDYRHFHGQIEPGVAPWNEAMQNSAHASGCTYVPPGTPLSSEGNTANDQISLGTSDGRFFGADGEEHGKVHTVAYELETVIAQMPDGSTIKGYGWDNTSKSANGDTQQEQ